MVSERVDGEALMWMLHCDKVSKYISDSMDRKLTFWQRAGVRMHLMMCKHCARFERQLKVIRKESRKDVESYPQERLDESVKENIKQLLKDKDSS